MSTYDGANNTNTAYATQVATSNTTPSPQICSATTEYGTYSAWKAFNQSAEPWASGNELYPALMVDFGAENKKCVNKYSISCGYGTGTPKSWVLQGSDTVGCTVRSAKNADGWIDLDTRTNSESSVDTNTPSSIFLTFVSNGTTYRYYRLYITGNVGGLPTYGVAVNDLKLVAQYIAPPPPPPPPPPSSKVPSGDIVPRSNGFGGLGTSIKKWLNGYFYNIFATGGTISGVNMISASGETISGPVTTSAGVGDARKLVALSSTGKIDSTMISGTIGGSSYVGLTWNMATSSIPVLANNGYFLNPTANITLTLPASPAVGDPINIVDIYNKASTYVITVARNGNNIEGIAEDLIINIDGAGISLVYADAIRGWELVSEIGRRGINSSTAGGDSFLVSQIFS